MEPFSLLEKRYSEHLRLERCCAVNTGTAALHIALEALNFPLGTKILVPDFTMYSSALAVYYARLEPVFVDCDDDLLINLDDIEKFIDQDTRAIIVTHIYGRVVNMDRVMEIASKYNLRVIEDACEAQGATWNNQFVGTFDIGCFSLYRNKIINAEEGGIVASKDGKFLDRVTDMKSMSFGATHDYYHKAIGFNYRITNSQSLLAMESLSQVEYNIRKREEIKDIYNSLFEPIHQMKDNRKVVWVYDMQHPNADHVVKELKKKNVAARHAFKPMSSQPLFKTKTEPDSNALRQSKKVFYLHINPQQTNEDLKKIASITKAVMERCK